jgi:hypothetical protein
MTGPIGPVRSDSDHFGLVRLVRPVRFACKGNQDGPIPRTNKRTEQRQGQQSPELPLVAHRDHFGDQLNG